MGQRKNRAFVERADRRPVSLRGFALNAGHDADIEVSELSYTGCRFDSADKFKRGERDGNETSHERLPFEIWTAASRIRPVKISW